MKSRLTCGWIAAGVVLACVFGAGAAARPAHVVAKIADCGRYVSLNPHFAKAFAFLQRKDLATLAVGRYEIDGDNCWAMVQEAKLTPLAGGKVESHRRYVDIQAPISGPETFGLMTLGAQQLALPFDVQKDYMLFDAETKPVTLQPGEFALFFPPTGGHAPCHSENGPRTIRKLVIKVKDVPPSVSEQATEPLVRKGFNYRFHAPARPEPGKAYPLVLLLHGAGERGTDNRAQLKWGADELVRWFQAKGEEFYFVAGQVPNGKLWVEVDWSATGHAMPPAPSESMAGLIDLVEDLFKTAAIDRSRVYVTGISMGGYGTWDLLCRKPEWFAAGMPICGGGDPAHAERIRDVPIWAFHGDADTAVPVCRSRKMTAALWEIGGKVRYREYYGYGHNVWSATYGDKAVLDWFFGNRRK